MNTVVYAGVLWVGICLPLWAGPIHFFDAIETTDRPIKSAILDASQVDRTTVSVDVHIAEGGRLVLQKRYRVFVTEEEYVAGWDALPQEKKAAAKAAAEQERGDYEKWTERERKLLKLLVQELNILRQKAGLAPRTRDQVINALKDL